MASEQINIRKKQQQCIRLLSIFFSNDMCYINPYFTYLLTQT